MSDPVIAVFMLGLFIFMVMLGFPIAFTLIAMGLGFGYYAYYDAERMHSIFDNRIFDLFVQNTFSVMSNDVLVAVPLFLFMGYVVERANIVNRLFFSIQLAARHLPGLHPRNARGSLRQREPQQHCGFAHALYAPGTRQQKVHARWRRARQSSNAP